MGYTPSYPLNVWHTSRRAALQTLQTAHATMGEVVGPGRPLELGRPVAHAYVLRLVAEFQAFTRDLHDLAGEKIVEHSGASADHRPMLTRAATEGRNIDYGNPGIRSLENDFKRLGLTKLAKKVAARNGYWNQSGNRRGDCAYYRDLIDLRNCLAHGNQKQLDGLRGRGVPDTVTWARHRLPGLDRMARAMDRAVWDYLRQSFGLDPW